MLKKIFVLEEHKNIYRIFALLFIGFFIGIIISYVFKNKYYYNMANYNQVNFDKLSVVDIEQKNFLYYILINNFRRLLIFCFICFTFLGLPNIIFQIFLFGFKIGFMLSVISIQYGIKGILILLLSQFPHGFIYLMILYLSLNNGFRLCRTLRYNGKYNSSSMKSMMKSYLPLLLFIILLIIIGGILETYIGVPIIKRIVKIL